MGTAGCAADSSVLEMPAEPKIIARDQTVENWKIL
jgi:hypothetical protein